MSVAKRLPMIQLTPAQVEWLQSEKERTGQTQTAIVRQLIQREVERKGRK